MFIVPVPRGEGFMNLVWQFQGDAFIYQTIDAFRQGNSGQVEFGWVMFTELLDSHNLALVRGTLQSGLLTRTEAAKLVRLAREAYMDDATFKWVRKFNLQAREFDYEEYMRKHRPLERWHAMDSA